MIQKVFKLNFKISFAFFKTKLHDPTMKTKQRINKYTNKYYMVQKSASAYVQTEEKTLHFFLSPNN